MTAFVINGGATTKWDSLAGGSTNVTLDTYTISNGTTLLIDTDSYQCAGHAVASGSLDTVSFSGIGGTLRIDPTGVRVIAYTGGADTVPAIGTSITQGGVSAYLLGVWSGWQAEPTAVGAAMPFSGYIKVKDKTGGDFANSVTPLGGINAIPVSADVQGWIEVRGADTATITVPRIGKVEVPEAWFELGTTNGARGQVIPCPTTATVAGTFPGVWIETAAGSGVYERFNGVGSMSNATTTPTDIRGKVIWQTTGGIRIGSDGTNNVGFLPPTGCKVRIPAAILTCCTRTVSGSGPRVLPKATPATRQEFITTSSGDIDISGAVVYWWCNFQQPYRVRVRNSAVAGTLVVQESASALDIDNIIVSPTQTQIQTALSCISNFAGGSIQNCSLARFSLASSNSYVNTFNYNKDVTLTNVRTQTLTDRANATTGTWTCTQNVDCTWDNCFDIGGRSLHVGDQRSTYTNHKYADLFKGTTGTGNGHYALDFTTGCVGALVDGLTFNGLTNVHPYSGLFNFTACYDWKVRNIGAALSPLSLGSANQSAYIVNSGGNNDTGKIQRVYVSNTRTGTWNFTNTDNNITIESVNGDYADTSVITALNTVIKGCRLTASTTGQTAVYGTHFEDTFTSATVGKVMILCNEPTAGSAALCAITAGTPRFNSVGQVALTTIGDQVTWEMPYFAKGHTALADLAATLTGTNTGNLTYEFQYDKGAGYNGTWLTLNAANLTGAGAITPATGVRLKVRATCATANAGNLLTQIAIPTVTTSTDQNQTYPLDTFTLTLTGIQTGSDVVIKQAGTTTVINTGDAIGASSYAFTYETPESVDIFVNKNGFVPLSVNAYALASADASLPIAQTADRNFS